jgi:hypothetical protein
MIHAASRWRTLGQQEDYAMDEVQPRRHKGLGIASFIIAISVLVLTFLLFVVAGVMHNTGASTAVVNTIVGSTIFFFWFLDLVAVCLGIAGAVDRGSKKVFPILGIAFGGVTLVLSAALVLIGLHMAGRI